MGEDVAIGINISGNATNYLNQTTNKVREFNAENQRGLTLVQKAQNVFQSVNQSMPGEAAAERAVHDKTMRELETEGRKIERKIQEINNQIAFKGTASAKDTSNLEHNQTWEFIINKHIFCRRKLLRIIQTSSRYVDP